MTSPESQERTAAFFWPGFADMDPQPAARLHDRSDGIYSVIEFGGGLTAHLHTTAQCDAIIKAAVAAKDLLLGAQATPDRCQDGGRCILDAGHVTLHQDPFGAQWDDGEQPPPERGPGTEPAPLPPNHIDNAGHAFLATGPQAATCVVCGSHLAEDGSHIAAVSGAHIPAEPVLPDSIGQLMDRL